MHKEMDKSDTTKVIIYIDCQDAYNKGKKTSGLYTINPDGKSSFKVTNYCHFADYLID